MPVTNYTWDTVSDNVLMETDELGSTTATYTNEPELYGGLVSQRRGSKTSFYHFDGLGSTRELTDSAETVTDTNLYDAWGVNVDSTGVTENSYRYVGEFGYYFESEGTSLFYSRARIYGPAIARWMSRDPLVAISVTDPILFPYAYTENNPLNSIDPSGLSCCSCKSGLEKHHWFPQFGDEGQGKVNRICKGKNKIVIHNYTTPLMNKCKNTPHWWMEGSFGYNDEVASLMEKHNNDCCMFLVAMIDVIHRAYSQLKKDLKDLNDKRTDDGCPRSPMPKCVMQKYRKPAGAKPDTKGDLAQQARDACDGRTFDDIKSSSLKRRIRERAANKGIGCVGLKDPLE